LELNFKVCDSPKSPRQSTLQRTLPKTAEEPDDGDGDGDEAEAEEPDDGDEAEAEEPDDGGGAEAEPHNDVEARVEVYDTLAEAEPGGDTPGLDDEAAVPGPEEFPKYRKPKYLKQPQRGTKE